MVDQKSGTMVINSSGATAIEIFLNGFQIVNVALEVIMMFLVEHFQITNSFYPKWHGSADFGDEIQNYLNLNVLKKNA